MTATPVEARRGRCGGDFARDDHRTLLAAMEPR
jgi:hypothetical protein